MPLASLEDVRRWLAEDKLEVDDATIVPFEVESERLIKAMLSGVFTSAQFQSWTTPEDTPPLISSISGKLIAAYVYRKAYAEDETSLPPYAQALYNEALTALMDIRRGTLVVLDASDQPVGNLESLTSLDFYPNDGAPGPKFSMEREFG